MCFDGSLQGGYVRAMTVGDHLRESAARQPDRIALIGRGERLTYAEFDARANGLARALLDLGLAKGAKVAVLSTNCPSYAIAYFAIARTPYVSAHCSTRSAPDELSYVLNKVEAEAVFLESRFAGLIGDVVPSLDRPIRQFLFDQSESTRFVLPDAVPIVEFVHGRSTDAPSAQIDERDGLAITLTGGTTGQPKAVLVSHKARCASAIASALDFGLDQDDIVIASTPLFHTAGLFVWFGTAVMLGASVVLADSWDAGEFMKLVEEEKVTAAFLVPSQLNDLIGHPGFSAAPLKTLRNIGYAGAPMGRALFERIRQALPHVAFTENYGQSEACPMTIRRNDCDNGKLGTVGRAAINAEISVVDSNGRPLPAGEVGNIVTRGDQLFDGYFNDPEETEHAFRLPDGWLQTGDVGFLDEDGFLTLVDRSTDMLITGGENVYPAEIENALYQHEAVKECAVFGVPDDRWGEVPAAHIVLSAGATVSADELIGHCESRIARFKRPRTVRFVDNLPKTPVGKIRKDILRKPYWAERDRKI